MNNFQTGNNFVTLTDEELENITGGFSWYDFISGLIPCDMGVLEKRLIRIF